MVIFGLLATVSEEGKIDLKSWGDCKLGVGVVGGKTFVGIPYSLTSLRGQDHRTHLILHIYSISSFVFGHQYLVGNLCLETATNSISYLLILAKYGLAPKHVCKLLSLWYYASTMCALYFWKTYFNLNDFTLTFF